MHLDCLSLKLQLWLTVFTIDTLRYFPGAGLICVIVCGVFSTGVNHG